MNINGTVRNDAETLPGANVFVSDAQGNPLHPTNGTATDINGLYNLENVKESDFITFSFVGYRPQTINMAKIEDFTTGIMNVTHEVGALKNVQLNVKLEEDLADLPTFEVVENLPKKHWGKFVLGGVLLLIIILAIVYRKKLF